MPRIIINTTKNDDWIRSLPGYQNEVALINSLEKKRVHKGGKGSGNFGHAGRIGKVGGSRDRSGNFDAWFAGSKVVNADGSPQVVYHGGGEPLLLHLIKIIKTKMPSMALDFISRSIRRLQRESILMYPI